jgi:tryptophanyl-tRNA synthetase
MSKSDENQNAYITLLDSPDTIIRKFKRAVTDSEALVRYDIENKPGISNLISIYSCVTGKTYDQVEAEFEGKGYGDFKLAVGEAVAEALKPVQARYNELMSDKAQLEAILKKGADSAEYLAMKTLRKVYKKLGLVPRPR